MKTLAAILLFAAALPAAASDFVLHGNDKPQTIDNQAHVQVINFWATWCGPCRKEMPEMSRWYSQKGKRQQVQMIGIAVDSKENVTKFLAATPVSYPIWPYNGKNSRAMMRDYGNRVGGLPYTVVRAPKCNKEQAIIGEVDSTKLDRAVAAVTAQCK